MRVIKIGMITLCTICALIACFLYFNLISDSARLSSATYIAKGVMGYQSEFWDYKKIVSNYPLKYSMYKEPVMTICKKIEASDNEYFDLRAYIVKMSVGDTDYIQDFKILDGSNNPTKSDYVEPSVQDDARIVKNGSSALIRLKDFNFVDGEDIICYNEHYLRIFESDVPICMSRVRKNMTLQVSYVSSEIFHKDGETFVDVMFKNKISGLPRILRVYYKLFNIRVELLD